MTNILNNTVSLREAYISKLTRYCIDETERQSNAYKNTLKKAKCPLERRAEIRSVLVQMGYTDGGDMEKFLKVMSLVTNDPSIAEPPTVPVSQGTCIVIIQSTRNPSYLNQPLLVEKMEGTTIYAMHQNYTQVGIAPVEGVRYATPEEIQKFITSMNKDLLATIVSGNRFQTLDKFTSSQQVIVPEEEQQEEEEAVVSAD